MKNINFEMFLLGAILLVAGVSIFNTGLIWNFQIGNARFPAGFIFSLLGIYSIYLSINANNKV